jgi:hypothetical protein
MQRYVATVSHGQVGEQRRKGERRKSEGRTAAWLTVCVVHFLASVSIHPQELDCLKPATTVNSH